MRNRYPGPCYRCCKLVEPGQGHFEWHRVYQVWLTQHASCAIKFRGDAKGREEAAANKAIYQAGLRTLETDYMNWNEMNELFG